MGVLIDEPALQVYEYGAVPPVGETDILPLHAALQVMLDDEPFAIKTEGCDIDVVNDLTQPLLSVTEKEWTPAHRLEIVLVVIALVVKVGPGIIGSTKTVYGKAPPFKDAFTDPLHKPKHKGCTAPKKLILMGVGIDGIFN